MCGASIPDSLNKKLETSINNDEETTKFGSSIIDSKFMNIEDNSVIGLNPGYDYSHLDSHGLIKENTPMNDKVVVIGKATNSDTRNELIYQKFIL